MELEKPMVSVCMITYNHESFIKEAINGVLTQQTDFQIEVIISNDCSTDNTDKLIKELIGSNSNKNIKFSYFNQSENLGMMSNFLFALKKCQGKYVALCEGDDYWIDKSKIKRQVNFLENNTQYALSTENSLIINTLDKSQNNFNHIKDCDISIGQLLRNRQFTTASTLFRREDIKGLFKLNNVGDIVLWSFLLKFGKIKYNSIISSVYRRGEHGIVESTNSYTWALLMEKWNKEIFQLHPTKEVKELINNRNHSHFFNSSSNSLKKGKIKNALLAILKSIKYDTIGTLSKILKKVSFNGK